MNGRQSIFMSNSSSSGSSGVGVLPRSVQLDFEKEEKKIQQFESTNKKFYKDVKYYVDKLDELIKSETKMIHNLSSLTSINPTATQSRPSTSEINNLNDFNHDFLNKLNKWKDILNEHIKSSDQLKQSCQSSVIEPMKNLNLIFPQVYQAIKRREQALKEFLKQQDKLDKLQDKERTGATLVRINELTQSVNSSKQQFQKEHSFLMEELPKLYNSRIDYIKPCVSSLIRSQSSFYDEYSKFYESILSNENELDIRHDEAKSYVNLLPENADSDAEIEKLSDDIQKCLLDIKSLSIVASD